MKLMQTFPYQNRIIYIQETYQLCCTEWLSIMFSLKKHKLTKKIQNIIMTNGIWQGIDLNLAAILKEEFLCTLNIIAIVG